MNTICLNMIVKNESKIIKRLIDSVSKFIDCYCICDTGSTDETVNIISETFASYNIPGKIIYENFKNFSYNRNIALKSCYGMSDYILLLDADMCLKILEFDKTNMIHDYYYINQGNNNYYYYNIRIIKNNGLFNYKGVTHEYISKLYDSFTAEYINKSKMFINDFEDGKSRIIKYKRDIDLLLDGLKEKSDIEGRYYFYLGNTYSDIGNYKEAIDAYIKRIEKGCNKQEVWYSNYKIGICYKILKNRRKAIYYWCNAYSIIPERIENIYEIVKQYREIKNFNMAEIFYNLGKKILDLKLDYDKYLFVHYDIYKYKLDYEYSIFAYYIGIENINSQIITILNNCDDQNIIKNLLLNMKLYKYIIKPILEIDITSKINYSFKDNYFYNNNESLEKYENIEFKSSSCSIIENNNKDGYIINMRLVNYTIDSKGNYNSSENKIITLNKYIEMDKNFNILIEKLIDIEYIEGPIIGIEDVKIFRKPENNKIIFIGSKYLKNSNMGIVIGDYNINITNYEKEMFIKNKTIECCVEPLKTIEIKPNFNKLKCEKNWVYFDDNGITRIIYKWYPLQICNIDNANLLTISQINTNMPKIFKYVRGSTNGFKFNNELWFIVHIISKEQIRKYYHIFVVFNKDMNSLIYSAPFKFEGFEIEYTIGLIIEETRIITLHSTWDKTSKIFIHDKETIKKMLIYSN